jgi:DNA-binding MarR family transcriptional regulator
MRMTSAFIDTPSLRGAFVANQLDRLARLVSEQGEILLQDAGFKFPSRTVSSILLIGKGGPISIADIANTLSQPHQLVAQRVDILLGLGLIERTIDPNDKRRKILKLTDEGVDQFQRLQVCLQQANAAFTALFQEIDCDLSKKVLFAMDALTERTVLDRVNALQCLSDT